MRHASQFVVAAALLTWTVALLVDPSRRRLEARAPAELQELAADRPGDVDDDRRRGDVCLESERGVGAGDPDPPVIVADCRRCVHAMLQLDCRYVPSRHEVSAGPHRLQRMAVICGYCADLGEAVQFGYR